MVRLTRDDKIRVEALRKQGLGAKQIVAAYAEKGWALRSVERICQQVDCNGTFAERKAGSGKPRTARSEENIAAVTDLICSQENKAGTHLSTRAAAAAVGVSRMSVWRIAKKDLGMTSFKRIRVQVLNAATRMKRLARCKQLLRRLTVSRLKNTLFTDEKMFFIDPPVNSRNDCVWSAGRKRDVVAERLLRQRAKFSARVMVSAGVCFNGKSCLHFVPKTVKVNADFYQKQLLSALLLDGRRLMQGDFVFQQDGAPAHTAANVQAYLKQHCPDFIEKEQWPPNSPDINPLDFYVWGAMLHRYEQLSPRPRDIEQLKVALQRIWDDLPLKEIQAAVLSVRKRLSACIKAEGGHFEHLLP